MNNTFDPRGVNPFFIPDTNMDKTQYGADPIPMTPTIEIPNLAYKREFLSSDYIVIICNSKNNVTGLHEKSYFCKNPNGGYRLESKFMLSALHRYSDLIDPLSELKKFIKKYNNEHECKIEQASIQLVSMLAINKSTIFESDGSRNDNFIPYVPYHDAVAPMEENKNE